MPCVLPKATSETERPSLAAQAPLLQAGAHTRSIVAVRP